MASNPPAAASFASMLKGATRRRDDDDDDDAQQQQQQQQGHGTTNNAVEAIDTSEAYTTGEYDAHDTVGSAQQQQQQVEAEVGVAEHEQQYYAPYDEEDDQPRRMAPAGIFAGGGGGGGDNAPATEEGRAYRDADGEEEHHDGPSDDEGEGVDETMIATAAAATPTAAAHMLPLRGVGARVGLTTEEGDSSVDKSVIPHGDLQWLLMGEDGSGSSPADAPPIATAASYTTASSSHAGDADDHDGGASSSTAAALTTSASATSARVRPSFLSQLLTFLPTADLILSVKYCNKAMHRACAREIARRLVKVSYAPPVAPLSMNAQLRLAKPALGMVTTASIRRANSQKKTRSSNAANAGDGDGAYAPAVGSSGIGSEGARSPLRRGRNRSPTCATSSSANSAMNVETLARLQAPNAALILATIRGDIYTLSDCIAVRYDRELLETTAWASDLLSSHLPPRHVDTPSYFFCDLSTVRQGFLVDGVMAGPICQLLLPPTDRKAAAVDEEYVHDELLTTTAKDGGALTVAGKRNRGGGVEPLSDVNERRRRQQRQAELERATEEASAMGKSRRSAAAAAPCANSKGLRVAKIVGQFYVGRRGVSSSSSAVDASSQSNTAANASHRMIDLGLLPYLYRGTAQIVVDQPFMFTALATGTSISPTCTISLGLGSRYATTLAPRAHTHAELSFGDTIVVSSRVPIPNTNGKTRVAYRQITQGCLYTETRTYNATYAGGGGGGSTTSTATLTRMADGTAATTTSNPTLLAAYVAAHHQQQQQQQHGGGALASVAPSNVALVSHHAAAGVPPPCSFAYTAGEVSALCTHILKASDKIVVLGFSPAPLIPIPRHGAVFAPSGRGLQTHLKDMVNSAAAPPRPLSVFGGGGGGATNASTTTASLAMLDKLAACFSEGSPDMCPPEAWSFPIAVYVDGFAAPSLFLPPTPLSTPVTELRQMIMDATCVSTTDLAAMTAAAAAQSSNLPPMMVPLGAAGSSTTNNVVASDPNTPASGMSPRADSKDPSSSSALALGGNSWLPTGARFMFNVYGGAALRAMDEVNGRNSIGGGGGGGGSRGRSTSPSHRQTNLNNMLLANTNSSLSAPSSPSNYFNQNFNNTNASFVSCRSAAGFADRPVGVAPLPVLYEPCGIPIAMSTSPLSGPNVDYTDAEDALREAAWVHVPQRTQPFSVSLIDLLPYNRDGAFSSDFLSANPSLLHSKGAVGGGWSQGVSGIADRVLAIVISPIAAGAPSSGGGNGNGLLLGGVTPPSANSAEPSHAASRQQQQQQIAGAAADLSADCAAAVESQQQQQPFGSSAVARARSLRLQKSLSGGGVVADFLEQQQGTSMMSLGSAANSPFHRYTAAYTLAADCCRLGDVHTLKVLFDWTGASSSAAAGNNGSANPSASFKGKNRSLFGGAAATAASSSSADQQQQQQQRFYMNVNDRGAVGVSLLHIACEYGKRDVISFLLSMGASIFLANSSGKLPIHICAEKGHAECLPLLLRGSFSWSAAAALQTLSAQDHAGRTPLHVCLQMRFVNTALWLVEQGADVAAIKDLRGDTAADLACRQHATVADLCRAGDHKGAILTLLAGTLDASQFAAYAKATNPLITGPQLEEQLSSFYVEVLKHKLTDGRLIADLFGKMVVHHKTGALIDNITGNSALHEAVLRGQTSVVHALLFHPQLAHFIDIFAENANGDTILHTAAACGSHELVQMILTAASRMAGARYGGSSGAASAAAAADNADAQQQQQQRVRRRSMYDTSRRRSTAVYGGEEGDEDEDEEYTSAPSLPTNHQQQQGTGASSSAFDSLALTDVFDLLQWRNRKGQTVAHLLFAKRLQHTVRWLLQWVCGGCGCESFAHAMMGSSSPPSPYEEALYMESSMQLTLFARKMLTQVPDAHGLTVCHYAIDALLKPSGVYGDGSSNAACAGGGGSPSRTNATANVNVTAQSMLSSANGAHGGGASANANEEFVQELILFALPATIPFAMPNTMAAEEHNLCEAILGEGGGEGEGDDGTSSSPTDQQQRIELPPVYSSFSPLQVAFANRFGRKIRQWEEKRRAKGHDGKAHHRSAQQHQPQRPPTILESLLVRGSPAMLEWYLTTMRTSVSLSIITFLKQRERQQTAAEERRKREEEERRNANGDHADGDEGEEEARPSIIIPSTSYGPAPLTSAMIRSAVNSKWPIALFGLTSDGYSTSGSPTSSAASLGAAMVMGSSSSSSGGLCVSPKGLFTRALHCGCEAKVQLLGGVVAHTEAFALVEGDHSNNSAVVPTAHRAGLFITNGLLRPSLLLASNSYNGNSSSPMLSPRSTAAAAANGNAATAANLIDCTASAATISATLYTMLLRCESRSCVDTILSVFGPAAVVRAVGATAIVTDADAEQGEGEEGNDRNAKLSPPPPPPFKAVLRALVDEHASLCAALEAATTRHVPPLPKKQHRPGHVYSAVSFRPTEYNGSVQLANPSFTSKLGDMPGVGDGPRDALTAAIATIKGGDGAATIPTAATGSPNSNASSSAAAAASPPAANNNGSPAAVNTNTAGVSFAASVVFPNTVASPTTAVAGSLSSSSGYSLHKRMAHLKEAAEHYLIHRIALLEYAVASIAATVAAAVEARAALGAAALDALSEGAYGGGSASMGYGSTSNSHSRHVSPRPEGDGAAAGADDDEDDALAATAKPVGEGEDVEEVSASASAAPHSFPDAVGTPFEKSLRRAAVFVSEATLSAVLEATIAALTSPTASRSVVSSQPSAAAPAPSSRDSPTMNTVVDEQQQQNTTGTTTARKSPRAAPSASSGVSGGANRAALAAASAQHAAAIRMSTVAVFGESATDGTITFAGCYELLWAALCRIVTSQPACTFAWTSGCTAIMAKGAAGPLLDVAAGTSRNCARGGNSTRTNKYLPRGGNGSGDGTADGASRRRRSRRRKSSTTTTTTSSSDGAGGGASSHANHSGNHLAPTYYWATRHSQHLLKAKERFVDLLPFVRLGNGQSSAFMRALVGGLRWLGEASLALQWFGSVEYAHRAALSHEASAECRAAIEGVYAEGLTAHVAGALSNGSGRANVFARSSSTTGTTGVAAPPPTAIDTNVAVALEAVAIAGGGEGGSETASNSSSPPPAFLRWSDDADGDAYGLPLLHTACLYGHQELVATLLTTGQFEANDVALFRRSHRPLADRSMVLDRPPCNRSITFYESLMLVTPLHLAVMGCHTATVSLLLAVGADPSVLTGSPYSSSPPAAVAAADRNDASSGHHTEQQQPSLSVLHLAAINGDDATMDVLLSHPLVRSQLPAASLVRVTDSGTVNTRPFRVLAGEDEGASKKRHQHGNNAHDGSSSGDLVDAESARLASVIPTTPFGVAMLRTPLHYACAAGATNCALQLLRAGASLADLDLNGDSPILLAARGGYGETIMGLTEYANDHMTTAATMATALPSSSPYAAAPKDALLFARNPLTNMTVAHAACWWTRNRSMLLVMDTIATIDAANTAREVQRKRDAFAAANKAAAEALTAQRLRERKAKEAEAVAARRAAEEEVVRRQLEELSKPLVVFGAPVAVLPSEGEEEIFLASVLGGGAGVGVGGAFVDPLDALINVTDTVVNKSAKRQQKKKSSPILPLDLVSSNLAPIAWGADVADAVTAVLLPKPQPVVLAEVRSAYERFVAESEEAFDLCTETSLATFAKFVAHQQKHRARRTVATNATASGHVVRMDEETASLAELLAMCTPSSDAGNPMRFALELITSGGTRRNRKRGGAAVGSSSRAGGAAAAARRKSSLASVEAPPPPPAPIGGHGGSALITSVAAVQPTIRWTGSGTAIPLPTQHQSESSHAIFMPPTVPTTESVWFQVDHYRFPDTFANVKMAFDDAYGDINNVTFGTIRSIATANSADGGGGGRRRNNNNKRRAASAAAAEVTPYLETRAAPSHYARANHNHAVMHLVPPSAMNTATILRDRHNAEAAKTALRLTAGSGGNNNGNGSAARTAGPAPRSVENAAAAAAAAATVPTELLVCYSSTAIAKEAAASREREEAARRAIFFPQNATTRIDGTVDEKEFIMSLTSDAIAKVYAPPPPPPPPPRLTWPGYYGRDSNGVFKALGLPYQHITELSEPLVLGSPFVTMDTLLDTNIYAPLAFLLSRGDAILSAAEKEQQEASSGRGTVARMSTAIKHLLELVPSVNTPLTAAVGTTALMIAAYHGQPKTVAMLLDHGADVTMTAQLREAGFNGGITALTAATLNGYTAIAETLLQRGAEPNVPDECGNTPLHHAVQHKHIAITKLLLRYGALMSVRNHAHHIPEDIAIGLRYKPLMRTLLWWRMAHAAKVGREYPENVPCDTAVALSGWLHEATGFYKRLDSLHEDPIIFRNTDEHSSVAVICYVRICEMTGTTPMRSIINQLTPHWFPEEVRRLELSGIYLEDPLVLNTVLTLIKVLPRLEILDFVSCSLTNALVATICTNLVNHPNVRRLNFSLNKHLSKVGSLRIEELLRANGRIIDIIVANTGLDTATALNLSRIADDNKRTLAAEYNEYSYSTAAKKKRLEEAINASAAMAALAYGGGGGGGSIDDSYADADDEERRNGGGGGGYGGYFANPNTNNSKADAELGPSAGPSRFVNTTGGIGAPPPPVARASSAGTAAPNAACRKGGYHYDNGDDDPNYYGGNTNSQHHQYAKTVDLSNLSTQSAPSAAVMAKRQQQQQLNSSANAALTTAGGGGAKSSAPSALVLRPALKPQR